MQQLDISSIKSIQIGILKKIDSFCQQHNIKYSLTYGTLLGAIRHKGYIPWDDDIDIMMPRPDYMKFIQIFNENQTEFKVLSMYNDDNYPYSFAKIENTNTKLIEYSAIKYDIGINIDVFPVDGVPSQTKEYCRHFKKVKRYRDILMLKTIKLTTHRNFLKNLTLLILKVVFSFISYQKLVVIIEREILKYQYEDCDYVMCPCINAKASNRVLKGLFEDFTTVDFEGERFFSIAEYDEYLTVLYGDYMKLPPIEQQVTHHSYDAFYR